MLCTVINLRMGKVSLTHFPCTINLTNFANFKYKNKVLTFSVSPNYAHGKGLVVLNDKNGIWISHSVPRFPPSFEESYSYPDSGRNFGQTVICVTFSNKEAAIDIVEHLLTIRPYIYSEYYAEPMMKIVKNFQSLKNRRWSSKKFLRKEIKSLANTEFILFSKSNKENYDLYDYYISPYIKSNLLAETWRRGAGRPLPSDCKPPFEVHNVQVVNLPFTSGKIKQSGEWKYLEDHSKWAISETKIKSFVCISDLNRMQSQFKRGGGAVCFRNAESWLLFKDSIAGIEGCPRNGSS
ncbi:Deoxyribonuclease-2-like protein [Dinothrombium tinctorium]|uniref:Deoxyribonuclease-2-like protein n=1 Tax=Dinothrombium tinctorium TaxID=1965070 RepID=A0A443QLZ2_9ACAR|nr:Deoxyribonuclease-2-like protein [Dinothrombium tinctorium]